MHEECYCKSTVDVISSPDVSIVTSARDKAIGFVVYHRCLSARKSPDLDIQASVHVVSVTVVAISFSSVSGNSQI